MQTQRHLSYPKYRPDIDGLRAVAVLAVVVFHASPRWLPGGFIGVDIFFVISGYLISTILFETFDNGRFNFCTFYGRRIKRIFPALILVLTTCLAFGWLALLADEFKQLGKHVAAGAVFVSNLVLWSEAGYFDTSADSKPLLHLWSLGIEEQFYIVCPSLLWLVRKNKFRSLAFIVLLTVASFVLNIQMARVDLTEDFYSPATRVWELMCGSLLAWRNHHMPHFFNSQITAVENWIGSSSNGLTKRLSSSVIADTASITGLLLITTSAIGLNKSIGFPGGWALVPVIGTILIISAGSATKINRTLLSNKLVVWFGLISFPLYLWHWPLLSFSNIVLSETPNRSVRLVAVIVSIILAALTYHCIEKPIRFGNSTRRLLVILTAFMVALGGFGYSVYALDGLPSRQSLNVVQNRIIPFTADDPLAHSACLEQYGLKGRNIRYCRLSGNTKPRIALIGDSHAAALFEGLSQQLVSVNNEGLLLLGGRLFIDVATYPKGSKAEISVYRGGIEATNFVAQEKSLDTVIMVSMGAGYINGVDNFYLLSDPLIKNREKVFEMGMRKTLDLMLKNNKNIIFVLDNPRTNFNPKACIQRPLNLTYNETCSMPRAVFDQEQQEYRRLVFTVLADYPTVRVFDQAAYFCNTLTCVFKVGSKILYSDDGHLSGDGSNFIANELMRVLKGAQTKLLH
jgi:peptidoglycan/LPS O-acetylase OafA/YrhL